MRLGADEDEQRAGLERCAARRSGCPRRRGLERVARRGARAPRCAGSTSSWRVRSIRSTRYRDMSRARSASRTSRWTRARVPGEEDRRLAGRVAAADDRDRIAARRAAPPSGRRVVDAGALELARGRAPSSGGSARRSRSAPCARRTVVPSSRRDDVDGRRSRSSASPRRRHADARAELLGLDHGPLGQLGAGDARPGSRGSSRSATRCRPARRWRPRRARPCRGPRTRRTPRRPARPGRRRRRPGRSRPLGGRRAPQADALGELGVARVAQHLLSAPDHDRRLLGRDAELAQQRLGVRVAPRGRSSGAGRRLRAANSRSRRVSGE